ncbi:MAG: amino acid permease, partial [Pontiella sp.]|nr:amino acid permease [Pontiella sp.]
RYATSLYAPIAHPIPVYAAAAVLTLTMISILGVHESKWVQNILTVAKVAGIAFIIAAGLLSSGGEVLAPGREFSSAGLRLGMILVLYTYGGWNEVAYVAAEIRQPGKNIVRALVLGTLTVTVLYLLINGAFFKALGYERIIASDAVAVDAVASVLPDAASRVVAVIICISALGAVNGMIFTGARISYALGEGHRTFRLLGRWHSRLGTPVAALLLQGLLSLGIVLLAGSFIDTILYSAPAVWLFFLGSGISLFVLRQREPARDRPFRATGYPVVPLVFCATCIFMFCGSASYAFSHRPIGLLVLLCVLVVGGVLARCSR